MMKLNVPLEDILKTLGEMITNARIYVALNALAYTVRSDSVPCAIGKIVMTLKLHPIMSLDKTDIRHHLCSGLQPS